MFPGRLDNPYVGLVRNEQIHVVTSQSCSLECLVAGIRHRQHGSLEDLSPGHLEVIAALLEHLLVWWMDTPTSWTVQQITQCAVGLEVAREQPTVTVGSRPQQSRPNAVSEQNAGRSIGVIGDSREAIAADHQDIVEIATCHHTFAD